MKFVNKHCNSDFRPHKKLSTWNRYTLCVRLEDGWLLSAFDAKHTHAAQSKRKARVYPTQSVHNFTKVSAADLMHNQWVHQRLNDKNGCMTEVCVDELHCCPTRPLSKELLVNLSTALLA